MADQDPTTGRFVEGNRVARKHGLRSDRDRAESRQERRAELLHLIGTSLGDIQAPGEDLLRGLLADSLTDVRDFRTYMDGHGGPISTKGQLRRAYADYRGALHDSMRLMDMLGAGPRARAQIMSALGAAGAAMRQAAAAGAAQARLRAKVAAAEASDASNGRAEALSASEVSG